MKAFLVSIICAFSIAAAIAETDVEFEFAIPDDGLVTLGVFDGAGKLVRTLYNLSNQSDFHVGVNGLIARWDGKDDDSKPLPAGRFHVRGYLVGEDVRVEGENFLFNDFASDPGFPGLTRIKDFALLDRGDVLLLGDLADGKMVLARVSPEAGFAWSVALPDGAWGVPLAPPPTSHRTDASGHPLGGSVVVSPAVGSPASEFPPMLAADERTAVVLTPYAARFFSLQDGSEAFVHGATGERPALSVAFDGGLLAIASGGLLAETAFGPDGKPGKDCVIPTPADLTSIDIASGRLIGAGGDAVWLRENEFHKVPLQLPARSVALGPGGTFWLTGTQNGQAYVAQSDASGEILRTLWSVSGDPVPEKIRASRTSDKFAALESSPGLQRLRVMSRSEAGEWTIDWERAVREFAAFGFVGGKPAPDAGTVEQPKSLRFLLRENPLTGQKDFLNIGAVSDNTGSRLVSPDGLPLLQISSRGDIARIAISRGTTPGSLRLLQGNPAYVEEFSVTGLDSIIPLDAGDIELKR